MREITEQRTMTSRTYLNADGTYTAQIFVQPVHYQARDGAWQPIDTALTKSARDGFAKANTANVLKTYLSAQSSGWARVESGDASISFCPLNTTAASALSTSGSEAKGQAWANAALSYEVQPGALKETITLTGPGAPASFAFEVALDGLTATLNKDNSVTLDGGAEQLVIPPPIMQDAAGQVSAAVDVQLTDTPNGLRYTLAPDPAWLAQAAYPVEVDPSVTLSTNGPPAYASYDNPTYPWWTTATMKVGATGPGQAGAFRTLLRFQPSLPLDVEVNSAVVNLHLTGGNGIPVTWETRELPTLLNVPFGVVWSSDVNRTDLVVGRDLTYYASGRPRTDSNTGSTYTGIDATNVVQSWADKRAIRDGNGVLQTLPLHIVLHDTTDYIGTTNPSGGMLNLDTGYFSLYVNYSTLGWYMFQGNSRHTGRTQYPIDADAAKQWQSSLLTANNSSLTAYLPPSIVAIPNSASPTSGLPVIYAAIPGGGDTLVYRIEDQGATRSVSSIHLVGFEATGTPIALPGSSSVAPDQVYLSGNGTGPNNGKAMFYRIDALTSGGTTTWNQKWQRSMPNNTRSSLAYYWGPTHYTRHNADGSTTPRTGYGAIIAAINNLEYLVDEDDDHAGYMIALDPATGYGVWGHVDAAGAFIGYYNAQRATNTLGGLTPFRYGSTESSPALAGQTAAYANDGSCWNNARKMDDGSYLWQSHLTDSAVTSSVSLFNGRLFHGENGRIVTMDSAGGDIRGGAGGVNGYVVGTGAFSADHDAVIFGDVEGPFGNEGEVFAYNPAVGPDNPNLIYKWSRYIGPGAIRSSALVAGTPGSGIANIFIGSDDGFVHILNPDDGSLIIRQDGFSVIGSGYDQNGQPLPLNGTVRTSMAAYQGRLYVLSSGTASTPSPTLYCFQ